MRESRVLKKLRAGEIASCFKINFADGQASELAAMLGFDCLWLDQEHLAQNWSVINAHVWAAKAHNVDVMVRVPRGSYSDYVKPLELDATGILVPHIMSAQDARNVVQMTRFHPVGRRAIDGGSADGSYTNLDFNEYLRQANEQRFVIVQIEDPEPLEELDEIASIEGVDGLFFGPGDFSQAIGAPGEWHHPRLVEARKRVAEAANRHGKIAATTGSVDRLAEFVGMGYRFVSVGADVIGVNTYCQNILTKFEQVRAGSRETTVATQTAQGGYK
ncbi:4-hydroxy-2-oxoheptanedioate aldolase [Larkinella knui]